MEMTSVIGRYLRINAVEKNDNEGNADVRARMELTRLY